jgi:hypothetical protein
MPRILALLVLLVCIRSECAEPPTYQVTFKALTAFGEAVPIHVVALADPLHHRDLASHCDHAVCTDVPEGPYTYAVSIDSNGRKVEGSAVIYRKNQLVVIDVGLPGAEMDESSFPTIRGEVVGASEPAQVWIRLQPLYSDISVSARVNNDGSFQLDEVRPGNWMLLVFMDGVLVHYEPFRCKAEGNAPIRVNIHDAGSLIKA